MPRECPSLQTLFSLHVQELFLLSYSGQRTMWETARSKKAGGPASSPSEPMWSPGAAVCACDSRTSLSSRFSETLSWGIRGQLRKTPSVYLRAVPHAYVCKHTNAHVRACVYTKCNVMLFKRSFLFLSSTTKMNTKSLIMMQVTLDYTRDQQLLSELVSRFTPTPQFLYCDLSHLH